MDNILDADLLCDRVAFISNGNIVALDTPRNLKEKNSNHSIVIDYLYQGKREEQMMEAPELKAGIPFAYDEIISVYSQEPTLDWCEWQVLFSRRYGMLLAVDYLEVRSMDNQQDTLTYEIIKAAVAGEKWATDSMKIFSVLGLLWI